MNESRTLGLPPIDNQISTEGFYSHLEKLFHLFYPEELFDAHHINFQNGLNKGVTVKIQVSCIYMMLDYEFIKDKPAMARKQEMEFEALNVFFQYTVSNKTVYMYPRDRDNFPATIYGAELKANYFFLIVQAALKRMANGEFRNPKE